MLSRGTLFTFVLFLSIFANVTISWKQFIKKHKPASNTNSRKAISSAVAFTITMFQSIGVTQPTLAVGLGEHTTCAYPACTSQLEILQASAPGLVSNEVKSAQIQSLKDIKFVLLQLQEFSAAKDYASIRSGLRAQPAGSLRLTARKVKNYVEKENNSVYNTAYERMIDAVDDVDSLAAQRLREGSSDADLNQAIMKAISFYNDFLSTVDKTVLFNPSASPIDEVAGSIPSLAQ